MFRFAEPSYFTWLLLVVPILAFAVWMGKRQKLKLEKALGKKLYPFLTSSVSLNRRRWKWALEVFVLIFAIIALARPQLGTGTEEVKSEGIELIIAFDVSSSMLTEDVRPSRIEFAKREVFRLIEQLSGDKVGVVAFAGSAALVAPMTTDRSALKMFVDSLSTSSVGSQGTEFRKALSVAQSAFERGGVDTEDETVSVTRAILLVSDGEDNEPGAVKMAEELVKKGTYIFSLAFGTEKGGPIPVRSSTGDLRGYKKDSKGQTVLSATKGTILKKLAEIGKGSFYHATFGGNVTGKIVSDINSLQKTKFENQVITTYSERYQIFLIFALIIGLIEILLAERYAGREIWRGRFETPQR